MRQKVPPPSTQESGVFTFSHAGLQWLLPAADLPGPALVTLPGTHQLGARLQGPHGGCLAEPGASGLLRDHPQVTGQSSQIRHPTCAQVTGNRDQMRGSSLEMLGQTRGSAMQTANSPLGLPSPGSELIPIIYHFHFLLEKVPLPLFLLLKV